MPLGVDLREEVAMNNEEHDKWSDPLYCRGRMNLQRQFNREANIFIAVAVMLAIAAGALFVAALGFDLGWWR